MGRSSSAAFPASRTSSRRVRLRTSRPAFDLVLRKMEQVVRVTAGRVRRQRGWDRDAGVLSEELLRALYCKAAVAAGGGIFLSLPPRLDALWHALILETQDYADVCRVLRAQVHHTCQTADDSVREKNKRVQRTLDVYAVAFPDHEPDAWCWEREAEAPPPSPKDYVCKSINGAAQCVPCSSVRTVHDLKLALRPLGGFAPAHIIYAGRRLPDDQVLGGADVPKGAVLFVVSGLRGC